MRAEVRHLVYFVAAAEELNFTRAAGRLHLVPQALSSAIAQLEDIVGVRLFERSTRRVVLTAAGVALLPYARAAIAAVDAGSEAARAAARALAGRLRVGLSATGALALTPRLLRAYAERFPAVEVEVRHFDFTDPSGGLWAHSSDVALVRPPFDDDGLLVHPLASEARCVVLPADHRLAGSAEVSFSELVTEPWMDVLSDPLWCDFWSVRDRRSGPVPRGAICMSQDDLFEAARAHRAIGLVPVSVARAQAWPGLEFAVVNDIPPSVVAVAHASKDDSGPAVAFARLAREMAGGPGEMAGGPEEI